MQITDDKLLLPQQLDDATMQKIASELNLSETSYVRPLKTVEVGEAAPWITTSRHSLRWFTPNNEIPLCGHATLATAHVLYEELGKRFRNCVVEVTDQ